MGLIIEFTQVEKFFSSNSQPIIVTGGCFDVIHPGHIAFLEAAKNQNGFLTILLESDTTVKRLKGDNRPIHTLSERAYVLSHIDVVDGIVLLPPLTQNHEYRKLITAIKPSLIAVTKNDPLLEVKKDHAQAVEAKIVEVIDRQDVHASSHIANRLHK